MMSRICAGEGTDRPDRLIYSLKAPVSFATWRKPWQRKWTAMSPIGSRMSYVKIVCPCSVHSITKSILGMDAQGVRWTTPHCLHARRGPFSAVHGEGLSIVSFFRRTLRLLLPLVLLVSIVGIRGIVITTAATAVAE